MAMTAVRCAIQDRVGRVVIDRPEVMNAIDGTTNVALWDAFEALEKNDDVWVVVLSGAGNRAFCAGADLAGLTGSGKPWDTGISFGGGLTGIGGVYRPLTKPIVASVCGWAIGGGLELALACDIIVASESARFSIPEAKFGVLGYSLVGHRAIRRFPTGIAQEMMLTGRIVSALEAQAWGAINHVASDAQLKDKVDSVVEQLLAASPLATRATKAVLAEADGLSLREALSTTYDAVESYRASADYAEALRAISAKDQPNWAGR